MDCVPEESSRCPKGFSHGKVMFHLYKVAYNETLRKLQYVPARVFCGSLRP